MRDVFDYKPFVEVYPPLTPSQERVYERLERVVGECEDEDGELDTFALQIKLSRLGTYVTVKRYQRLVDGWLEANDLKPIDWLSESKLSKQLRD